ncbi:MAG TPA: YceI family protein [Thermoanaerobaculia bacterium]|jgi:polyisoprenoid-binding protein YceI|nr:YceI family protein [Thermoanaerobaculia bacterium]
MLRRKTVWLLTVPFCWLFALPLAAETLTFTLDPAATTIELGFGATLHSVAGTLRVQEGAIHFDPATGQATGRIVIDATSAETGVKRRDKKMHEKILESPKFPLMVFTVERISGTLNRAGRSEIELHGTLDMHGVQRPMDLVVTAKADGAKVAAVGHVTIPYLKWGMADPSFFILRVDKEVHVQIKANGSLTSDGSVISGATPAPPVPPSS